MIVDRGFVQRRATVLSPQAGVHYTLKFNHFLPEAHHFATVTCRAINYLQNFNSVKLRRQVDWSILVIYVILQVSERYELSSSQFKIEEFAPRLSKHDSASSELFSTA